MARFISAYVNLHIWTTRYHSFHWASEKSAYVLHFVVFPTLILSLLRLANGWKAKALDDLTHGYLNFKRNFSFFCLIQRSQRKARTPWSKNREKWSGASTLFILQRRRKKKPLIFSLQNWKETSGRQSLAMAKIERCWFTRRWRDFIFLQSDTFSTRSATASLHFNPSILTSRKGSHAPWELQESPCGLLRRSLV